MQLYVITCLDRPDAGDLRAATRSAHLDFVREALRVRIGGPFLDDAGKMIGSLMIVEGASLDEVKAFARADPYARAGLFSSVEVRPWKQTVGPVEVTGERD
ncbi:MAG: YciI family protein [Tsuneonella sp.]